MKPTLKSIFLDAIRRGPVLILDNMEDRTHAETDDPIIEQSPQIRLVIAAADLGATVFCFNPRGQYNAVLYALQPDSEDMRHVMIRDVPAIGVHWCALNSMFFVDEVQVWGNRVRATVPSAENENVLVNAIDLDIAPMPARCDLGNPAHRAALLAVREHFKSKVSENTKDAAHWRVAMFRLDKHLHAPVPAEDPRATGKMHPEQPGDAPPAKQRSFADTLGLISGVASAFLRPVPESATASPAQRRASVAAEIADVAASTPAPVPDASGEPATVDEVELAMDTFPEHLRNLIRWARQWPVTITKTEHGGLRFIMPGHVPMYSFHEAAKETGWTLTRDDSKAVILTPSAGPVPSKPTLSEIVWFCRHARQNIDDVAAWPLTKFREHCAALRQALAEEQAAAGPRLLTVNMHDAGKSTAQSIKEALDAAQAEAGTTKLDPEYLGETVTQFDHVFTSPRPPLRDALRDAINRCSAEGGSNTPDFILAEYLGSQLAALNHVVNERDRWYGMAPAPGQQEHRGDKVIVPACNATATGVDLGVASSEPDQTVMSVVHNAEGLQADLDALAGYIMDEHASTGAHGSHKVVPEAVAPMPGESGPSAALRLLKFAASRGAFSAPSSMAIAVEADSKSLSLWLRDAFAPGKVDEEAEYQLSGDTFRTTLAAQVRRRLELALARGAFNPDRAAYPSERDAVELQGVHDLLHERQQRLSIAAGSKVPLLDVLRGLIADAHMPSVDARDMQALRERAESAERQIAKHKVERAELRIALTTAINDAGHEVDLGAKEGLERDEVLVERIRELLPVAGERGVDSPARAQIVINQVGQKHQNDPGPRDDGRIGAPVHLRNANNANVSTWRWKLVAVPDGSTAKVHNPVSSTASFTPDVLGSYVIELLVNEGHNAGLQHRVVFSIRP